MSPSKQALCPQCRQPSSLVVANRFRPFCSERCKMLDLGEWFAERHTIPVAESDADFDGEAPPQKDPRRLS
ncbi:MAG: DNA gyrase inhibitor YacG [Panacagrimonas sp.]